MNQCINQRKIPGLSRLYADYLYDFRRLSAFYPSGWPYRPGALEDAAAQVKYPEDRRRMMADVLRRQNRRFGCSEEADRMLDLFAQPGTVAVVTGQQVGLFGGPLLGVHKAMTAVRLAEGLRERGVPAVALFWLASQDHDLAEINHAWVPDRDSKPTRIETATAPAIPGQPVGPVVMGAEIEEALRQFEEATGATAEQMQELREAYQPGVSLAEAFARLMIRWFAPWGLLLFDPMQAPEAGAMTGPVYEKVLARQEELSAALGHRARELETAGYHVQVHQGSGSTMLFLHHRGAREGLRRIGGQYLCGDDPVSEAEVLRLIRNEPDQVSPSALLRPLLQDTLFPTVTQVTGPAETAYLAQSSVIYAALGVRQPAAWPRCSVTLLDARGRRLLEKYNLSLDELWSGPIDELLAHRVLPAQLEERVNQIRGELERDFAELVRSIEELDPTLIDATQTTEAKIKHQLEQLQGRVARSFTRRRDDLRRHACHLAGTLYPHRTLQERLLNAAAWKMRHDGLLLQELHDRLAPSCPDHQLIAVGS